MEQKKTTTIDILHQYVESQLQQSVEDNDLKTQKVLNKILMFVHSCKATHEAEILLANLKGKNEVLVEMNEIKQSFKSE